MKDLKQVETGCLNLESEVGRQSDTLQNLNRGTKTGKGPEGRVVIIDLLRLEEVTSTQRTLPGQA